MSFRGGRGRGRGRGRGGYTPYAQNKPFELFPEIKDLPALPKLEKEEEKRAKDDEAKHLHETERKTSKQDTEQKKLAALQKWNFELYNFWSTSSYYYENPDEDIGRRYSDKDLLRIKQKPPLYEFMKMTVEYVPAELGDKKVRHPKKKIRWSQQSESDFFEKLNEKPENEEDDKEKKQDGEEEDEDNQEGDQEYSTEGDYEQNIDFDDDEDDFNMPDDNDGDEGFY